MRAKALRPWAVPGGVRGSAAAYNNHQRTSYISLKEVPDSPPKACTNQRVQDPHLWGSEGQRGPEGAWALTCRFVVCLIRIPPLPAGRRGLLLRPDGDQALLHAIVASSEEMELPLTVDAHGVVPPGLFLCSDKHHPRSA